MKVKLVFSGRNYHAAEKLPEILELPDGATVKDALQEIDKQLELTPQAKESLLVILSGNHLGNWQSCKDEAQALRDGDELVLLAPVAGG